MKVSFSTRLKRLFGQHSILDDAFFDDLIDSLIEGDVGTKTAFAIEEAVRKTCKAKKVSDKSHVVECLKTVISTYISDTVLMPHEHERTIYLVLGVNGVGKTTSIAKLACYYQQHAHVPLVLAAADTFRAAAVEQLQFHGQKIDVRVIAHQQGGDPAAVVFDAADSIAAQGGGLVLADTAGRLHTKDHLIKELEKIHRIASKKADVYKKLLVLDATTGQNAFRQAEVFHEAIGIDAIMLTKYDSTAKGGAIISIGKELGIPIAFIGTGESYGDLSVFNKEDFVNTFVGLA